MARLSLLRGLLILCCDDEDEMAASDQIKTISYSLSAPLVSIVPGSHHASLDIVLYLCSGSGTRGFSHRRSWHRHTHTLALCEQAVSI